MEADVAVIIVTYNSEAVLVRLLESLEAAASSCTLDVIVVDNGSSDRTRDIARGRNDCRLICSDNVGYAGGINIGFAAATANSILVLNPDVIMHERSIEALERRLRDPAVGIVVPKVVDRNGRLAFSLRREPSILRATGLSSTGRPMFSEYVTDPRAYTEAGTVDWALGAVMMISRRCFATIGNWDESYFLYSEETDYCLRARDAGLATLYEPQAVVTHFGGGSGQDDLTHSMQIVNRVRLYARRHGPIRSWVYYALNVLSEASWIIRGHAKSKASLRALLLPSARPAQLNCGGSLVPR